MAFKFVTHPLIPATVEITVPGQAETAKLDVVFRYMGLEALGKWTATHTGRKDIDILDEIIDDMPALEDAQGAPVPYSRDALARLLNDYPASSLELLHAYRRELLASRAKN